MAELGFFALGFGAACLLWCLALRSPGRAEYWVRLSETIQENKRRREVNEHIRAAFSRRGKPCERVRHKGWAD